MRWIYPVLAMTAALHLTGAANADSREDRLKELIGQHRAKAETLSQESIKRRQSFMGTAFNEAGVNAYTCAVLAHLFGKDAIFQRLGMVEEPDLANEKEGPESQGLSGYSTLHNNWADSAERVLAMDQRDRIETWNLNCVRQHGIGVEDAVLQTSPRAEFKVVDDQLTVIGEIDSGFFARFKAAVMANPHIKVVALGSGGGNLSDALQAGILIRALKLETTLMADCYSACPLVFLGGVQRTIWSPYPRLGFHQASRDGNALATADPVYAVVKRYADGMGVNGDAVVRLMLKSPPSELTYPAVDELCEPNITTWVQRAC